MSTARAFYLLSSACTRRKVHGCSAPRKHHVPCLHEQPVRRHPLSMKHTRMGAYGKARRMVARAPHTPCAPHTHTFCIPQKIWCTWNITSRMHRCRGVGHSAVHSSMCAAACTMHRACTIKGLLSTSNIRGAAKIKKKLREFRGIKTKRDASSALGHKASLQKHPTPFPPPAGRAAGGCGAKRRSELRPSLQKWRQTLQSSLQKQ